MKPISISIDKIAIGISFACAVHCLFLPMVLVLLPTLAPDALGGESFHQWMLIAVLPTSFIALTMGCRRHGNMSVLATALPGLFILTLAAYLGHDRLGENGETLATLLGSTLIVSGHFRNHILGRRLQCDCKTHLTSC